MRVGDTNLGLLHLAPRRVFDIYEWIVFSVDEFCNFGIKCHMCGFWEIFRSRLFANKTGNRANSTNNNNFVNPGKREIPIQWVQNAVKFDAENLIARNTGRFIILEHFL